MFENNELILWECWVSPNQEVHEDIWYWVKEHQGWVSSHPCGVAFWLPAEYAWYLILLDPKAFRQSKMDYVS